MPSNVKIIGNEANPLETINMASPPTKSVVVDLWEGEDRPIWTTRRVELIYKVTGLATIGTATATPNYSEQASGVDAGSPYHLPAAIAAGGGPNYALTAWIAGTTAINLKSSDLNALGPVVFTLGHPLASLSDPIFPARYLYFDLSIATWTAGTLTWWIRALR